MKLLSLDVWDTLIRREVYPEYPKLYTMNVLLFKYRSSIDFEYRCKHKLYKKRIDVESQLVQSNAEQDGEYDIYDVFYILLQEVTNLVETDSVIEELVLTEVRYEKSYTYPDPTINEFITNIERDKTVFISDFYMDSEKILDILASNGVMALTNSGFTSCEAGCNKRSTKLFKFVHDQLDIGSENHTHIGDHELSDYVKPKSLGINAIHYWPEMESKKRALNEKHWYSREALLRDLLSGANVNFNSESSLSTKITPLLVGFLLNIAEHAISNKIDFIGFCTREGEFFHQLWKELFPDETLFGVRLPETGVVEVSRMSTFAPTITELTTEQMQRMWSLFKTQSISAMLASLNVRTELVEHILDKYEIDPNFEYSDLAANQTIVDLFNDREFCHIVETHCSEQNALIKNYLGTKFKNSKKVAIVDIGWRGTIQDNICKLFPEVDFIGFYLGLYKFINNQESNSIKNGYCFDLNLDSSEEGLIEDVSIYEMLFNSPNGTVVGYKLEDGKAIAEKYISQEENKTYFDFSQTLQKNISNQICYWMKLVDKYILDSSEFKPVAQSVLTQISKEPEQSLLIARSNLHHNETFGLGRFLTGSRPPSYYTIISSPVSRKSRKELVDFYRSHKWPQSIEIIEESSWFKKKILVSILKGVKLAIRLRVNITQ